MTSTMTESCSERVKISWPDGSAAKGRTSFIFQSNIQEDLSVKEIVYHLQPKTSTKLEDRKRILINLTAERERIAKKFSEVSTKLAYAFVYSLPSKTCMSKYLYCKDFMAKTTLKLAVLFDVYKKSLPGSADEKVEALFGDVMVEVEKAKVNARQQRDNRIFLRRVFDIVDSIMKDALTDSGVAAGKRAQTSNETLEEKDDDAKKKALGRYRALLGMGQAISRRQVVQIVCDLLRVSPGIEVQEVASALDKVLGLC